MPLAVIFIALAISAPLQAQTETYTLGRGLALNDALTLGGYFSTNYFKSDNKQELLLDDVAILLYGESGDRLSYLLELESVEPWAADLEKDTTSTNLPPTIERLYVDYKFSDELAIRIGKQITPIGYWNLQPINVLRETTSSPLYSSRMFPRFLTGIDIHGYVPAAGSLVYHVYLQNTRDMDEGNINIKVDSHYGAALEKTFGAGWSAGGSTGRYTETAGSSIRYLQLNARYDTAAYSVFAEASTNRQQVMAGPEYRNHGFYLQGEYRVTPRQILIARQEYLSGELQPTEHIFVLGYGFRPVYPVSFKVEHQWHRGSNSDAVVASFSVLF